MNEHRHLFQAAWPITQTNRHTDRQNRQNSLSLQNTTKINGYCATVYKFRISIYLTRYHPCTVPFTATSLLLSGDWGWGVLNSDYALTRFPLSCRQTGGGRSGQGLLHVWRLKSPHVHSI